MSRGPGRWQRRILEAVADGPIYLRDLLPEQYTRSQYSALHRAATTLADAGAISYWHFTYASIKYGPERGRKVALGPPGCPTPSRSALNDRGKC